MSWPLITQLTRSLKSYPERHFCSWRTWCIFSSTYISCSSALCMPPICTFISCMATFCFAFLSRFFDFLSCRRYSFSIYSLEGCFSLTSYSVRFSSPGGLLSTIWLSWSGYFWSVGALFASFYSLASFNYPGLSFPCDLAKLMSMSQWWRNMSA